MTRRTRELALKILKLVSHLKQYNPLSQFIAKEKLKDQAKDHEKELKQLMKTNEENEEKSNQKISKLTSERDSFKQVS